MGSHQMPFENRDAQALRAGEVGGCTGQSTRASRQRSPGVVYNRAEILAIGGLGRAVTST
jgi:hypothetical protein